MSKQIIKPKPLMVLSLPCAAQFPKKQVNEQLKEKISKLELDGKMRNRSQFIDVTGTNGGYPTAFRLIQIYERSHNIVLVGWSMGGSSALLLANTIKGISGIVTLGAASYGKNLKGVYHKNIPYLQCHNKHDKVIPISEARELYENLNGKNNDNHTFEISEIEDGDCHQYDDMIDMSTDWILDHFIKNQ